MKVTELIKKLQNIIESYGDMDVYLQTYEDRVEVDYYEYEDVRLSVDTPRTIEEDAQKRNKVQEKHAEKFHHDIYYREYHSFPPAYWKDKMDQKITIIE